MDRKETLGGRVLLVVMLVFGIAISLGVIGFGVLGWAIYVGPRPMPVDWVLMIGGIIVLGVLGVIVCIAGIARLVRGYQGASATD